MWKLFTKPVPEELSCSCYSVPCIEDKLITNDDYDTMEFFSKDQIDTGSQNTGCNFITKAIYDALDFCFPETTQPTTPSSVSCITHTRTPQEQVNGKMSSREFYDYKLPSLTDKAKEKEEKKKEGRLKKILEANRYKVSNVIYKPGAPWDRYTSAPELQDVTIIKEIHDSLCKTYIKQGKLDGRNVTFISKTWKLDGNWDGFFNELSAYSREEYLYPFQGILVPRIIGIYLDDSSVSLAMELPSSSFWVEASRDLSNFLKHKCIMAFDAIHDLGILHNCVDLRSLLINERGNVLIVDFQQSKALNPQDILSKAEKSEIALEKRLVRFLLNYEDARKEEAERRVRAITRRFKNTQRRKLRNAMLRHPREVEAFTMEELQSDPEDEDMRRNPIPDYNEWSDIWKVDEIEPTCYIVPGQTKAGAYGVANEFVQAEIEGRGKYPSGITKGDGDSSKYEKESLDPEVAPNHSPETLSTITEDGSSSDTDSVTSSHRSLKRGRDDSNIDSVEYSPKRRHRSTVPAVEEIELEEVEPTDEEIDKAICNEIDASLEAVDKDVSDSLSHTSGEGQPPIKDGVLNDENLTIGINNDDRFLPASKCRVILAKHRYSYRKKAVISGKNGSDHGRIENKLYDVGPKGPAGKGLSKRSRDSEPGNEGESLSKRTRLNCDQPEDWVTSSSSQACGRTDPGQLQYSRFVKTDPIPLNVYRTLASKPRVLYDDSSSCREHDSLVGAHQQQPQHPSLCQSTLNFNHLWSYFTTASEVDARNSLASLLRQRNKKKNPGATSWVGRKFGISFQR